MLMHMKNIHVGNMILIYSKRSFFIHLFALSPLFKKHLVSVGFSLVK